VNEFIIFATAEDIPLMIVWNVLVEVEIVFVLIIDDVALFPFTTEVSVFIAEDKLLLVLEATRFVRSVVVDIPLTDVVRLLPLVEISLLLITVVVATTPFTVVVKVLPDRD
jgi:hypothetical protein